MAHSDPALRPRPDRLAALDGVIRPGCAEPPPRGGDRAVDTGEARSGEERPDPGFWGPEPRRRGRARGAGRPLGLGGATGGGARWTEWCGRLAGLRVELGVGVLVVALVAAGAGVVWYRMGVAGGGPAASAPGAVVTPEGPGGEPEANADERTGAPGAGGTRGRVVVHVAGAVATPGVLVMPAGARVIDAVEGAGGARPDADLDRLNLAAKLVDGQRILVLAVGAVAPAGDPGVTGDTGAGGLVDLNRATAAELEALPGIGPALAAAILAERTRRGGFRSVNELREVRGIGEARFADIKDRVTV